MIILLIFTSVFNQSVFFLIWQDYDVITRYFVLGYIDDYLQVFFGYLYLDCFNQYLIYQIKQKYQKNYSRTIKLNHHIVMNMY